jgi:hypothetical protein
VADTETKKGLRARVAQAIHRHSLFGKIEEIADRRRHAFNKRFHEARALTKRRRDELNFLRGRKDASRREIDDAEQLVFVAEHKEDAMYRKREFWRDRYTSAHERHQHWGLVLKHRRDRLRRWIARHEGFQPYMANGNPYEKLTPEAKHAIYLDFRAGLYVTSTYEGYPGDGVHTSTSGHYVQNQPDGKARCWDAGAGSRAPMVKAQIREARRAGAFLTEMFGPDNTFNYKNGIQFSLVEGSGLETLHDTHKHTWIRDGAPT